MSRPMPPMGGADSPAPGGAPPAGPPGMGAAPPPDQGGGAPPSGQPIEDLIDRMFRICQQLRTASPLITAGMTQACQGLQSARTSLVMGRQTQTAPQENPPV